MKTVRLDAPLEAKLQEAMRLTGKPTSQIMRDALENYCDQVVGRKLSHELAGLLGGVDSSVSPGHNEFADLAEQTGGAFASLLMENQQQEDEPAQLHPSQVELARVQEAQAQEAQASASKMRRSRGSQPSNRSAQAARR